MKMTQNASIEVRMASRGDLDALVTFSAAMAMETEGRRLDRDRLQRGVQAVLESTEYGFYMVSERQDLGLRTVVGQLLITYEWSDWRNATFWWIQSVYVDTPWRRQGVYRQMHRHVVNMARGRQNVCGVRLYVEEHNKTAQQVYRRVGLMPAGYLIFEEDFVLSKKDLRQQGGHTDAETRA